MWRLLLFIQVSTLDNLSNNDEFLNDEAFDKLWISNIIKILLSLLKPTWNSAIGEMKRMKVNVSHIRFWISTLE